jgi:hypothetical protein
MALAGELLMHFRVKIKVAPTTQDWGVGYCTKYFRAAGVSLLGDPTLFWGS